MEPVMLHPEKKRIEDFANWLADSDGDAKAFLQLLLKDPGAQQSRGIPKLLAQAAAKALLRDLQRGDASAAWLGEALKEMNFNGPVSLLLIAEGLAVARLPAAAAADESIPQVTAEEVLMVPLSKIVSKTCQLREDEAVKVADAFKKIDFVGLIAALLNGRDVDWDQILEPLKPLQEILLKSLGKVVCKIFQLKGEDAKTVQAAVGEIDVVGLMTAVLSERDVDWVELLKPLGGNVQDVILTSLGKTLSKAFQLDGDAAEAVTAAIRSIDIVEALEKTLRGKKIEWGKLLDPDKMRPLQKFLLGKFAAKLADVLKLEEAEREEVCKSIANLDILSAVVKILGAEDVDWRELLQPLRPLQTYLCRKIAAQLEASLQLDQQMVKELLEAIDPIGMFIDTITGTEIKWREPLVKLVVRCVREKLKAVVKKLKFMTIGEDSLNAALDGLADIVERTFIGLLKNDVDWKILAKDAATILLNLAAEFIMQKLPLVCIVLGEKLEDRERFCEALKELVDALLGDGNFIQALSKAVQEVLVKRLQNLSEQDVVDILVNILKMYEGALKDGKLKEMQEVAKDIKPEEAKGIVEDVIDDEIRNVLWTFEEVPLGDEFGKWVRLDAVDIVQIGSGRFGVEAHAKLLPACKDRRVGLNFPAKASITVGSTKPNMRTDLTLNPDGTLSVAEGLQQFKAFYEAHSGKSASVDTWCETLVAPPAEGSDFIGEFLRGLSFSATAFVDLNFQGGFAVNVGFRTVVVYYTKRFDENRGVQFQCKYLFDADGKEKAGQHNLHFGLVPADKKDKVTLTVLDLLKFINVEINMHGLESLEHVQKLIHDYGVTLRAVWFSVTSTQYFIHAEVPFLDEAHASFARYRGNDGQIVAFSLIAKEKRPIDVFKVLDKAICDILNMDANTQMFSAIGVKICLLGLHYVSGSVKGNKLPATVRSFCAGVEATAEMTRLELDRVTEPVIEIREADHGGTPNRQVMLEMLIARLQRRKRPLQDMSCFSLQGFVELMSDGVLGPLWRVCNCAGTQIKGTVIMDKKGWDFGFMLNEPKDFLCFKQAEIEFFIRKDLAATATVMLGLEMRFLIETPFERPPDKDLQFLGSLDVEAHLGEIPHQFTGSFELKEKSGGLISLSWFAGPMLDWISIYDLAMILDYDLYNPVCFDLSFMGGLRMMFPAEVGPDGKALPIEDVTAELFVQLEISPRTVPIPPAPPTKLPLRAFYFWGHNFDIASILACCFRIKYSTIQPILRWFPRFRDLGLLFKLPGQEMRKLPGMEKRQQVREALADKREVDLTGVTQELYADDVKDNAIQDYMVRRKLWPLQDSDLVIAAYAHFQWLSVDARIFFFLKVWAEIENPLDLLFRNFDPEVCAFLEIKPITVKVGDTELFYIRGSDDVTRKQCEICMECEKACLKGGAGNKFHDAGVQNLIAENREDKDSMFALFMVSPAAETQICFYVDASIKFAVPSCKLFEGQCHFHVEKRKHKALRVVIILDFEVLEVVQFQLRFRLTMEPILNYPLGLQSMEKKGQLKPSGGQSAGAALAGAAASMAASSAKDRLSGIADWIMLPSAVKVTARCQSTARDASGELKGIIEAVAEKIRGLINNSMEELNNKMEEGIKKCKEKLWAPVAFVCEGIIRAGQQAVKWIRAGLDFILKLAADFARNVFDIVSLEGMGEVSTKKLEFGIAYHIKILGRDIHGGLRVNLNNIIMDLARTLFGFVMGANDVGSQEYNDTSDDEADPPPNEFKYDPGNKKYPHPTKDKARKAKQPGRRIGDKFGGLPDPESLDGSERGGYEMSQERKQEMEQKAKRLEEKLEELKKSLGKAQAEGRVVDADPGKPPEDIDNVNNFFADFWTGNAPPEPEKINCPLCGDAIRKEDKAKHFREKHPDLGDDEKEPLLTCEVCKAGPFTRKNLHYHNLDAHDYQCPHKPCTSKINKKTAKEHFEKDCTGMVLCPQCCLPQQMRDMKEHMQSCGAPSASGNRCPNCLEPYEDPYTHDCWPVTCRFCEQPVPGGQEKLKEHEAACTKRPQKCEYKPCAEVFSDPEEKRKHEEDCPFKPDRCPQCKKQIPVQAGIPLSKRRRMHEANCSKNTVPCKSCGVQIPRCQQLLHEQICPKKIKPCNFPGCKEAFEGGNKHGNSQLKCLECGEEQQTERKLVKHMRRRCKKTRINCCGLGGADGKTRCGTSVPHMELPGHLATCKYCMLKCSCGQKTSLADLPRHIMDCSSWPLRCPECWEDVATDIPSSTRRRLVQHTSSDCMQAWRHCPHCRGSIFDATVVLTGDTSCTLKAGDVLRILGRRVQMKDGGRGSLEGDRDVRRQDEEWEDWDSCSVFEQFYCKQPSGGEPASSSASTSHEVLGSTDGARTGGVHLELADDDYEVVEVLEGKTWEQCVLPADLEQAQGDTWKAVRLKRAGKYLKQHELVHRLHCPGLMISCPYGCMQEEALSRMYYHLPRCPKTKIPCIFEACPWSGSRMDLRRHLEHECDFHEVECDQDNCKVKYLKKHEDLHMRQYRHKLRRQQFHVPDGVEQLRGVSTGGIGSKILPKELANASYPGPDTELRKLDLLRRLLSEDVECWDTFDHNTPIKCKACGDMVIANQYRLHLRWECPKIKVACPHCNARVVLRKLDAHLRDECPHAEITCYACQSRFPRKREWIHVMNECSNSSFLCFYCEERVPAGDLLEHMKACEQLPEGTCGECSGPRAGLESVHRGMFCTAGTAECQECGSEVSKSNMEDHIVSQCSRRCYDCPYEDCEWYSADDSQGHSTLEQLLGHFCRECPAASMSCPQCGDTGTIFPIKSWARHLAFSCENSSVPCLHCTKPDVPVGEFELHLVGAYSKAGRCPEYKVSCAMCDQPVPMKYLAHHLYHECTKNEVPCKKCDWRGLQKDMSVHLFDENPEPRAHGIPMCKMMETECRKCGVHYLRGEEQEHKKTCAGEKKTCKDCGAEDLWDLEAHQKFACKERREKCFFCRQPFKVAELSAHRQACDARKKNDEGRRVEPGTDGFTQYCGKWFGPENLPGSDGRCGTHDGPQCDSCKRYQQDGQARQQQLHELDSRDDQRQREHKEKYHQAEERAKKNSEKSRQKSQKDHERRQAEEKREKEAASKAGMTEMLSQEDADTGLSEDEGGAVGHPAAETEHEERPKRAKPSRPSREPDASFLQSPDLALAAVLATPAARSAAPGREEAARLLAVLDAR